MRISWLPAGQRRSKFNCFKVFFCFSHLYTFICSGMVIRALKSLNYFKVISFFCFCVPSILVMLKVLFGLKIFNHTVFFESCFHTMSCHKSNIYLERNEEKRK